MNLQSFQCRSCCSNKGTLVLDLGVQPLANNLLAPGDIDKPEPKFPLRLAICTNCWLLQIVDLVPPVQLFSEYLYFSSFSDSMLQHAKAAAKSHMQRFGLSKDSFIVEIASNDGYLLQNFVAEQIPCLGIEPAQNIAKVAREKGVETICEFFGEKLALTIAGQAKQADLILGNNVFAHAPDTNDFVAGLKKLLSPAGVIVLEFPYGVEMIEKSEFDTIYHEHVFYFTLTALLPLFARHGLEIFDVERLHIHGGSLRLYVTHVGAETVRKSVSDLHSLERERGVASLNYYQEFAEDVEKIKTRLVAMVSALIADGKSVAAYGASAKGSTLLNFFGLGKNELQFVADRSTYKQGHLTPGTHIPIVAAEELLIKQPDYTLLLTWNFADEILAQQQAYRARGGKFIVPIPKVRIV